LIWAGIEGCARGLGGGGATALDHLKEGTQEMKICWDAWGLWFVCDDNDILVRDR
jgi:hypothetical protein